jgi:DNA-binding CsgD family transcriptional regulator/uncharacterized protein YkwD
MGFTGRQSQILELAARGLSDKQVARELGVSVHTVRTHLQRLYLGQGFSNRAEAVAAWMAARTESDAGETATPPRSHPGRHLHISRVQAWAAALVVFILGVVAVPIGRAVIDSSPTAGARSCGEACSQTPVASGPRQAPALSPSASSTASAAAAAASPAAKPVMSPPAPIPKSVPIQVVPATSELEIVNQQRAAAGLPPLSWNQCLLNVAEGQAQRMATQGFVSTANGTTLDTACRLISTPTQVPPAEVLNYWSGVNDAQVSVLILSDPTQKAEILGPYRHIGAAWAVSPSGLAFLAIELG